MYQLDLSEVSEEVEYVETVNLKKGWGQKHLGLVTSWALVVRETDEEGRLLDFCSVGLGWDW